MARQTGDIIIEGTIDNITFYKMEGKGYARNKTSLTGKRVKRDPRFKRTMQSANRFGRGNQLASKVYRSLPRSEQVYALFKELKRIAILAIKEGKSEEEVLLRLQHRVAKKRAPLCVAATHLHGAPARSPKADRLVVQRTVPRIKKLFGARGRSKPKAMRPGRGLRRKVLKE